MNRSQKPQRCDMRLPGNREPDAAPAQEVRRAADRDVLAAAVAACPGWRAWRTSDGDLAAREGGAAPPGPHARGGSLAELMGAIAAAIQAGPPPRLPPAEQAALAALEDAAGPLGARAVSDTTGLPMSSAARALTCLTARGLVTRERCDGRTWAYRRCPGPAHPDATPGTSADAVGDGAT